MRYVVLLRGINVGGTSKVPMADLKRCLEDLGYANVTTYIASGNAIIESALPATTIKQQIESALPQHFDLTNKSAKVLVLTPAQLRTVIATKPKGFGEQPATYHSDVIFLIDIETDKAIKVFDPREGIDAIWPGQGVIYSQRLSAQRTKSRLNKIMSTPAYQSITIRTYGTVKKLLELVQSNA